MGSELGQEQFNKDVKAAESVDRIMDHIASTWPDGSPGLQPRLEHDLKVISETLQALKAQNTCLVKAGVDLINDVRDRHPGEELKCEYMRALEDALKKIG